MPAPTIEPMTSAIRALHDSVRSTDVAAWLMGVGYRVSRRVRMPAEAKAMVTSGLSQQKTAYGA